MNRYPELDLLRTTAIVMMVIYHFAYDLAEFRHWNIDVFSGGWWLLARCTAALFLLLVGCSFAISWDRHQKKTANAGFVARWKKYLKRGAGVFACGLLVSLVTFLVNPETYVRFGILHMIGVSIAVLPLFAWMKGWNGILGLGFGLGFGFGTVNEFNPLLLVLGLMPSGFDSVDYFPMIPWFGFVLIGYAIGCRLYTKNKRSFFSINFPSVLLWPGRHALLIYLIHQPLLLGALGAFGFLGLL